MGIASRVGRDGWVPSGAHDRILVVSCVGFVSGLVGSAVGAVPLSVVTVAWTPGLVVSFGVLFGLVGVLAVTAGSLVFGVVAGLPGPEVVASLLAYPVMGYVAAVVWHGVPARDAAGPAAVSRRWRLLRAVAAVSVAATAGAVTLSWVYDLLGRYPFYLVWRNALSFWVAGLALGPPVVAVYQHLRDREARPEDGVAPSVVDLDRTVLVVPFAWGILGLVGSIGYRAFDVLIEGDASIFADRGLSFVLVLHNDAVFGSGARRIQAVLGGVMLTLLVVALRRSARSRPVQSGEGRDR